MCVYGPHFTFRCECVYMVFTLFRDVNACIWSSLYLEICMCVYGLHVSLRHKCVYMILILPSDMYFCIWSSLYLEMHMYVYGPHFHLRCVCIWLSWELNTIIQISRTAYYPSWLGSRSIRGKIFYLNIWLSQGLNTIIQISLLTVCILDISVSDRLLPELAWL